MSRTAEASMTGREAADLLAGLEGYEEELTARTAGLTWMVWGIAIPGLFMSYNAATGWLEAQTGFEWILSILWAPWILGASLATNRLWEATAVTLDWDPDSRAGWLYALGFTAAFFAIAAGIWGLMQLADATMGTNAWMLTAGGLLTVAIGVVYGRAGTPGRLEALVGGLVLAVAGVSLAVLGLEPPVLVGLLGAGLVGLVYYGMGLRLYRRG